MPDRLEARVPGSVLYWGVLASACGIVGATSFAVYGYWQSAVVGASGLILGARSFAVRVRGDDDGLRVRNVLRSYTIAWSEVTGLDVHDRPLYWIGGGMGLRRRRVRVTRAGRRHVMIAATQTIVGGRNWTEFFGAPRTAALCEALAARWTAARTPPPLAQ